MHIHEHRFTPALNIALGNPEEEMCEEFWKVIFQTALGQNWGLLLEYYVTVLW